MLSKKLTTAMLVLSVLVMYACSKDVVSKPSFKFMPPNGNGVALKAGSLEIKDSELMSGIENDLYQAQMKVYEIKFNRLKSLVIEKLMEQDPKKKGLSNDEYMDKYITSTVKISDAQIQAFIKEKNIPKHAINPQIKTRIKEFLKIEEGKKAVDNWLAKKTKSTGLTVYLQKPERPVFNVNVGNAPTMGGAKAKVTIVEFSDFQCPFCKKGAEVVSKLKKKYGNKIKVAFKQFPLPFHNNAKKAAQAALCADEIKKGSFWKFHDVMFGDQSKLAVADLKVSAKKLGLDAKKFETCLDSDRYAAQINNDMEEGKKVGVKSTPTFFVNGKLVSGAQPIEVFSEIIDAEL